MLVEVIEDTVRWGNHDKPDGTKEEINISYPVDIDGLPDNEDMENIATANEKFKVVVVCKENKGVIGVHTKDKIGIIRIFPPYCTMESENELMFLVPNSSIYLQGHSPNQPIVELYAG